MRETKKQIKGKFSYLVIFLLFLPEIYAAPSARFLLPDNMKSTGSVNIEITTDRSLYIAGENIYFSVFVPADKHENPLSDSTVFYIEIVDPNGTPLAQKKVMLDSMGSNGFLTIPTGISSGTYFIKGYTRWMRNLGPGHFAYLTIEIIDPSRQSLLKEERVKPTSESFRERRCDARVQPVTLTGINDSYGTRSPVQFEISMKEGISYAGLCLSVIPENTLRPQWVWSPGERRVKPDSGHFLTETLGVSMSGRVSQAEQGLPASYSVVYVTFLDSDRKFYCNYADSAGQFYFSFPGISGERVLFVSANHEDFGNPELFIDMDFSGEQIELPSYPLFFDEKTERIISALSLNAQISSQYFNGTVPVQRDTSLSRNFFYGEPSFTLVLDEYIRLPKLEEYFSELIPMVRIRKVNNKKQFHVLGEHADLNFHDPLVLIDGIAIFDIEAILSVSPGYIERVEIIDDPYIRGNLTFGGIINIISKDNDMGYVDLPSSGLLVNYKMIDNSEKRPQDYTVTESWLPDARNTLYWEPEVYIDPGDTDRFEFYTSDNKGRYEIVIRGYTEEGGFFKVSERFEVF